MTCRGQFVQPWPLENLLPELQRPIARYNDEIARIQEERTRSTADPKSNDYSEKLIAAQKAASKSNDRLAQEAISAASTAVPDSPPGLPSQLAAARRASYERALQKSEAIHRAYAGAESSLRKALDALASGQARNNPALLQQIGDQKAKLYENCLLDPSPASAKRMKGFLEDGGFDFGGGHWGIGSFNKVSKIVRNGADPVLRIRGGQTDGGDSSISSQPVRIPRQAKSMIVGGRVRGRASNVLAANDPDSGAAIVARFAKQGTYTKPIVLFAGRTQEWEVLSKIVPLVSGDDAVRIELKVQGATGDFFFDDLSVEFR
jgi:hypothetical protein